MPINTTQHTLPSSRSAEIILHFTPNWFTASMGTGILAVALGQFSAHPIVMAAGKALYLFNNGLFLTFTLLYALKWARHPQVAMRLFEHPVQSMFLGAIPMALATIINGTLIYGPSLFGEATALQLALPLWIADAIMAIAIGTGVPFLMFTRQSHSIADMSAVWLLPIVAAEVAAASGGLLLPHLDPAGGQLAMLAAILVLWACSVPLAMSVLVILFLRMVLHKLPPAAMAATSWLALGPIGMGSLGLSLIALNGETALAANGLAAAAAGMKGAAIIGALMLWGYGLWWLITALMVTLRQIRIGLPFNLGWWAYTFPIGVYSLATLKIGTLLPLAFFQFAGTALVGALSLVWVLVAARTFSGALRGRLFNDPCLNAA